MTIEQIASICHSANAAYCRAIGDNSQVPWEDAPEHARQSTIAGVKFRIENPDAWPEAQHEAWRREKIAAGWTFGDVKDAAMKTHPCLVPYADLPSDQRRKDHLFQGIVDSLTRGWT